jgi:excinuclease ABC subunit C
VLEKNLINQYKPFYNADFKDDKSYPFIAITKGDVYPSIKYTREKHSKNTRYFGPYTDSRAARELVDIARRVVPVCSNRCADWRMLTRKCDKIRDEFKRASKLAQVNAEGAAAGEGGEGVAVPVHAPSPSPSPDYSKAYSKKACFDAHVGLGPGACCGRVTPEEYAANIAKLERFLSGRHEEFLAELTGQMQQAAAELDFERAARYKSRIDVINSLTDKQHAVIERSMDADVIGISREETIAAANVLVIREGRIIAANEFILNRGSDVALSDLLHNFMLRYYDTTTLIPREVIVGEPLEEDDASSMEAWLTERLASAHGAKVHIVVPERGEKADLLQMAKVNARHALMRYKVRTSYDDSRINDALAQLESALALDGPPMRIECFDISTLHGAYTVASMVVFTGGKPDKNQYRRFKIKTPLDEANDFLSMQEVMSRRYSPERMADERFGSRPDLIILDGGRPQLNAALEMFEQMGVDIPVVGLAKRDEEVFVPWDSYGPVVLPGGSASLYLVKQVRDEAHRFAITFHRELRGKGMTASILDTVPGIGPVRKKALLKHFKSMRALREATLEQIKDARVVPDEVAEDLFAVLEQYRATIKNNAEGDGESHSEGNGEGESGSNGE